MKRKGKRSQPVIDGTGGARGICIAVEGRGPGGLVDAERAQNQGDMRVRISIQRTAIPYTHPAVSAGIR
jgi:hypothetical protein